MNRILGWLRALVAILVFLAVQQPIHAQFVRTNAYVNLLDGPHTDEATGPGAIASSQSHYLDEGEASASCVAVPEALMSMASSTNVGLSFPASGDAAFFESFSLMGSLPDTSQSITLGLSLGVNMQCVTAPGDTGSVAGVLVSYDFYSAAGRSRGRAQIGCQAGIPALQILTGGFEDGGFMTTTSSEATLTPTIDFGGVIEDLTGDDLDSLGLGDLDLTVPLEKLETDVSILVGLVAEALNLLGLQRLGIPPGLGLDVGFSTTFDVRGSVSVPLSVSPGGFLNGFVQSIASSSPADAQGVSSISGAVHVATAPEGFPDPEKLDLALEFESGRRMKVYLASALVFIDGFEFGDTLAWSGSVP